MKIFYVLFTISLSLNGVAQASAPAECIRMADESRAEMLRFKEGKSDELTVRKSTATVTDCIDKVEGKGDIKHKTEAKTAWKNFQLMREEKILPVVVRYNQTAKDNKVNLDKTKDSLNALGENPKAAECIKKADQARTALLLYKDGKGDETVVNQTAKDTSSCIDEIDPKGKAQQKADAILAWKKFREIREQKIIPDVKFFKKQSDENTANLVKTKAALEALN